MNWRENQGSRSISGGVEAQNLSIEKPNQENGRKGVKERAARWGDAGHVRECSGGSKKLWGQLGGKRR